MFQENLVGRQFSQYEIQAEIGRGAVSVVYRALQPSVNRQVAIKVLSRDLAQGAGFIQHFEKEMNLLARLEHFNILPIYGVGVLDGLPYIVMRYLTGGSLGEVLTRQHHLSAEVVAALTNQIAAGLDYAHMQGAIHRDLKPSNILFDGQGNAYVSDFGLNWLMEASSTVSGTGVIGTAAYLSPEVASGRREVTAAIDSYALGVILFEALTGQLPFNAPNPLKLAMMHLNDEPPSLHSLNRDISKPVEAVVLKALAKKPQERYQTAGELAEALTDAVGTTPGLRTTVSLDGRLDVSDASTMVAAPEEIPDSAAAAPPARRANEWLLFSAIATLLVLGIVVVGVFFIGGLLARQAPTPTPLPPSETVAVAVPTGSPPSVAATPTSGVTQAVSPAPTSSPAPGVPGGGGGKIAYISKRSGNPELYILDLTTSALIQVTHNQGKVSFPAWSPDGRWLAYISDQGKDVPHIFAVDQNGENPRDVTPRDHAEGYPVWLPGTETIGYYVLEGEDRVLRTVGLTGGDPVDVVRIPSSFKMLLEWTPDNHVIYYGFARGGNLAIVSAETVTGSRDPITVSGDIPFVDFSPDRARAAFTLMVGSQSQLFLADASCPLIDQCNARRLIDDKFSYTTPRFSPDGKLLMVASNRAGNFDLWLVDLDGKLVQKLPGSALDDTDGVWQP